MEIDMGEAMKWRKQINEVSPVKISLNDIIVKACAVGLRHHPMVNASWMGDKIRKHQQVHVGVAVAVDEGLLVPVIRYADIKTLSQINTEVKEMAGRARKRKLQPEEMQGNTFTVSNLGMFGIDEFTAIINPPDSCILAVGGIVKKPVYNEDGDLVPAHRMKVTLSCDHRVVDGATGAQFLQTVKEILENPIRLLV
jgi:pyruvate dehydrogenase E2 component (dihydrolipoamide acetyltransferase)